MNRIGKELFPLYLEVRRADVLAQSEYLRREKLDDISKVEAIYKEILSLNQCNSVKELAVNGSDLITEGIRPGREMGEILDKLLEEVLEMPERNTKEMLLKRAKEIYSQS